MRGAKAKMLRRIARGGDKELPERKYQPLKILKLIQMPVVERRAGTRTHYAPTRGGQYRKVSVARQSLAGRTVGGRIEPILKLDGHGNTVFQPEALAAPFMLDPECVRFVYRQLKRLYTGMERRLRPETEFVTNVLA